MISCLLLPKKGIKSKVSKGNDEEESTANCCRESKFWNKAREGGVASTGYFATMNYLQNCREEGNSPCATELLWRMLGFRKDTGLKT